MIQNKNKLSEVGLEPDKPQGHIRAVWAITLILAFAIVIGGGVYFILWYSPWGETVSWHRQGTADETKDWLAYENKIYSLKILYPTDWQYKEYTKNTGEKLDWNNFVSFYSADKSEAVKSAVDSQLIYDVGLAVYQDKKISDDLIRAGGGCQSEDKKIAGLQGKKARCFSELVSKYMISYYVVKNNNTYELTALEEKKDTLDKMLGTLNFGGATTSPTATQSNVKYKTFSDKIHVDFSFEYPDNLFAFGNISGEGYQGTVYILKQSADKNEMERTNIQVYLKMIQPTATDIKAAYKNVHGGDLSSDQTKFQNTTVAGVPALKYEETNITSYLLIKDNFLFEITAVDEFALGPGSSPLSDSSIKATFDHIVSSFKFQ